MPDTIRVVRVSDDDLLVGEVVFYPEDVIELSEERRATSQVRGTLNDERRRLVSEWEFVDA